MDIYIRVVAVVAVIMGVVVVVVAIAIFYWRGKREMGKKLSLASSQTAYLSSDLNISLFIFSHEWKR